MPAPTDTDPARALSRCRIVRSVLRADAWSQGRGRSPTYGTGVPSSRASAFRTRLKKTRARGQRLRYCQREQARVVGAPSSPCEPTTRKPVGFAFSLGALADRLGRAASRPGGV